MRSQKKLPTSYTSNSEDAGSHRSNDDDAESRNSNSEDAESFDSKFDDTHSLMSDNDVNSIDNDVARFYVSDNNNFLDNENDASINENIQLFTNYNQDLATNNNNNNNNIANVNINNNNVSNVLSTYTYMRNNHVGIENLKSMVKGLLNALYRDITIAGIKIGTSEDELSKKKLAIFEHALTTIDLIKHEHTEVDILFDLYFAINTVLKICNNDDIRDKNDLIEEVQRFLAVRGKILCGDEHDYCHNIPIDPNAFCKGLVRIVLPTAVVNNVLMLSSLQREKKWVNPYTNETNLPRFQEFFRTPDNKIQLYEAIVAKAVEALKMQCDTLDDIWFSTDNIDTDKTKSDSKDSDSYSDSDNDEVDNTKTQLTPYEMSILRDRSPSLEKLIQYSEFLQKVRLEKKTIYSRLNDLRLALAKGEAKKHEHDQARSGTDQEAGPEAGEGGMDFADWWSRLDLIPGGKDIQARIEAIKVDDREFERSHYQEFRTLGGRIKYILNPLPDPSRATDMRYCVQKQGEMLEEILKHPKAQKEIAIIDDTVNIYWSHDALDKLKSQILEELITYKFQIKTDKNYFKTLAYMPGFVHACVIAYEGGKGLDYFDLAHIANMSTAANYYSYFEPQPLGKVLVELVKSGNFQAAHLILEMKPEVLQFCHEDVFAALIHVMQYKPLDLKLIATLAKGDGIYTMQEGGKDLLAFAIYQLSIADRNSKHTNAMFDIILQHSLKKSSPANLVYALNDLAKHHQFKKVSDILKCRPDLLMEKVDYVTEDNTTMHRTILTNAVLSEDVDFIYSLFDKNIHLFTTSQLKAAVHDAIAEQKIKVVRVLLDFVDDENYRNVFTSGMMSFIVSQLINKKRFDMARMFLEKRPDCLEALSSEQRNLLLKDVEPERKALRGLIVSISKDIKEKKAAVKKATKKNTSILSSIFDRKQKEKTNSNEVTSPKPPV